MLFWWDMKTCFLFPGQGAQYPGMARDLWESSPRVKELFQSASDAVRMDMKKLLFDSSEDDLKATDKTQVAMTLASLCSSAVLKERGISPDACAGFSLGEYAALCEAGVLKVQDVFPIVRIRGDLMEKAARGLDSKDGAPGMAAVLGLPGAEGRGDHRSALICRCLSRQLQQPCPGRRVRDGPGSGGGRDRAEGGRGEEARAPAGLGTLPFAADGRSARRIRRGTRIASPLRTPCSRCTPT